MFQKAAVMSVDIIAFPAFAHARSMPQTAACSFWPVRLTDAAEDPVKSGPPARHVDSGQRRPPET